MHAWGLVMVGLIMSSQISGGSAGRVGAGAPSYVQQQQQQIHQNQQYRSLQPHLQVMNQ